MPTCKACGMVYNGLMRDPCPNSRSHEKLRIRKRTKRFSCMMLKEMGKKIDEALDKRREKN